MWWPARGPRTAVPGAAAPEGWPLAGWRALRLVWPPAPRLAGWRAARRSRHRVQAWAADPAGPESVAARRAIAAVLPGLYRRAVRRPGPSRPGPRQRGMHRPGRRQRGPSQRGPSQRGPSRPGRRQRGMHRRGSCQRVSSQPGSARTGSAQVGRQQPGAPPPGWCPRRPPQRDRGWADPLMDGPAHAGPAVSRRRSPPTRDRARTGGPLAGDPAEQAQ
jgi:hypothetical protein